MAPVNLRRRGVVTTRTPRRGASSAGIVENCLGAALVNLYRLGAVLASTSRQGVSLAVLVENRFGVAIAKVGNLGVAFAWPLGRTYCTAGWSIENFGAVVTTPLSKYSRSAWHFSV